MLVAALSENLWLVLRWAVVARLWRGGRDPSEEFTFKISCDWIRHKLEEELRRRWKIKTNGVGVPALQAMAAGPVSPRPVRPTVSDSFRRIPPRFGCYRLFGLVNWNYLDQLRGSSRD